MHCGIHALENLLLLLLYYNIMQFPKYYVIYTIVPYINSYAHTCLSVESLSQCGMSNSSMSVAEYEGVSD